MTLRPFFAWYDLWIGAFWSTSTRTLYLMPIPMVGIRVQLGARRGYRYKARYELGGTRPTMVRAANPEPPRTPWLALALALLLTGVMISALTAAALVIGGPR